MPPRRSHKKSKAGCQRCKTRKIKCDEVHPTCGNCSKHGVTCDFGFPGISIPSASLTPALNPPSLQRHSTVESSSNISSGSSPSSHSTILSMYKTPTQIIRARQSPAASRSLELKLMHHYTASTSQTLSNTDQEKLAWQIDIPCMAYDTQYLMDAILAVSALHLRSINPEDQSLVRASHGYMASALAQYSSLLNCGLSQHNAEALFSTSALIAFQASASRRFDDDPLGYSLPLAWFHSFRGVKTVVMASWRWLRHSDKVFPIINSQPPLLLDPDPQRKLFFAPLLEGLQEQLDALPESMRADTRQAYEHSVSFLNWAHLKPERSRILGFAATVSRRFVELIGLQDPRALVIISCFFALTKVVDDVWWLQGVAKREVMGIFGLLPQEWWGKMEWPMKIANHEGSMDEETWGACLPELEEKGSLRIGRDPYDRKGGSVREHIDILAQMMNDSVPPLPPD